MAKLKVIGDAAVVTSALKLEQIKKMQKYDRDALKLIEKKNDEETTKYVITIGTSAFSGNSAVFASANSEGFATATIAIPAGMSANEKKEYVKDTFGNSLRLLNTLEANIVKAEENFDKEYAKLDASIEIEG